MPQLDNISTRINSLMHITLFISAIIHFSYFHFINNVQATMPHICIDVVFLTLLVRGSTLDDIFRRLRVNEGTEKNKWRKNSWKKCFFIF